MQQAVWLGAAKMIWVCARERQPDNIRKRMACMRNGGRSTHLSSLGVPTYVGLMKPLRGAEYNFQIPGLPSFANSSSAGQQDVKLLEAPFPSTASEYCKHIWDGDGLYFRIRYNMTCVTGERYVRVPSPSCPRSETHQAARTSP